MTRLARSLALLATVGLLAACGKSDPSASTAKHASAGSSAERARALALARAINLTAADVPGFKASSRLEGTRIADRKAAQGKARRVRASGHGDAARRSGLAELRARTRGGERERGVGSHGCFERRRGGQGTRAGPQPGVRANACRTTSSCWCARRSIPARASVPCRWCNGRLLPRAPTAASPGASRCRSTRAGSRSAIYFDIFGFVSGPNAVTMFASGAPIPPPAAVRGAAVLAAAGTDEGRREGSARESPAGQPQRRSARASGGLNRRALTAARCGRAGPAARDPSAPTSAG